MIVSFNWLKDYVPMGMSLTQFEQRLMMAGLNHEGTEEVGDDFGVDLEVTSNRPDCLGHIGVAREVQAIFGGELTIPSVDLDEQGPPVGDHVAVAIDCPDLCFRYTARLIRGVKIGPSPEWMQAKLRTLGITPINNVVDITNYVLMENGQPLHAFDFAKVADGRIVVRRPEKGEKIEAIDHKTYELTADMCMICDTKTPVAIGGVMGGAATEISDRTTDVLVEAAEFDPISIRTTARSLSLHSDSSYRFERRVDPEGIDWASRRCCQLILQLAGGTLCKGSVDVGPEVPPREPVTLRFAQLPRVLGIEVCPNKVRKILTDLGFEIVGSLTDETKITVVPPTWRRDVTREIDIVEELARIHGYDKIPEDVGVRMAASVRRHEDRVLDKVRAVLTGCGIDEAMTYSVVDPKAGELPSPWSSAKPLRTITPVLRGADRLRLSLVPSLLAARRHNEKLANARIELFETAKVYLPREGQLPEEVVMLAITSGSDFRGLKGVIETVVATLSPAVQLQAGPNDWSLLDPAESCKLLIDGETLGHLGRPNVEVLQQFNLRGETIVAELRMDLLGRIAELIPRSHPLSQFPPIARALNLEVDDTVKWANIETVVRRECGELFESIEYEETYRDRERLGANKKRLLLNFTLRSAETTLTNEETNEIRDRIVAACETELGAVLR